MKSKNNTGCHICNSWTPENGCEHYEGTMESNIMKANNNYISLSHALALIQQGWIFRQDLKQTEFKVLKGVDAVEYHKLNKTTATEVKKHLQLLKTQTKIELQ